MFLPTRRTPIWSLIHAPHSFSFLRRLLPDAETGRVALVDMRAACGFPSPAADYEAEEVTLDQLMVRNPLATILVEAAGDSMVEAGIYEGDLLVVDREVEPRSGSIVLACYDGSFTVKRLRLDPKGRIELHPENPLSGCGVLRPRPGEQFEIEGVVTGLARRF